MKILILKPSSLGDVVHALPVLRMLRRHWPGAEIHWWIDAGLVGLLEGDPDLSGVIAFHRRRWSSPRHWPDAWRSLAGIREQHFDIVLDLQALLRSAVVAWLANGRAVIGLDDRREGAPAFHDQSVPRVPPLTHAVDWYLGAVTALGLPLRWDFEWLPPRPAAREAVMRKWPVAGSRWITLQPGARWPNKRWPTAHFASLVRDLGRKTEARFAVLGSQSEHELGNEICRAAPGRCLNLAGATSLSEMIEWLRLSSLLVTNDSGPMHVAAALGRPVVALFGPTEPRRTGPYGQLDNVLQTSISCAPCLRSRCHHSETMACLQRIDPARAGLRVMQLLAAAPAGSGWSGGEGGLPSAFGPCRYANEN